MKSALFALGFAVLLAAQSALPFPLAVILGLVASVVGYFVFDFLDTKEKTFSYELAWRKYKLWRGQYFRGFFALRKLQAETKDIKTMQQNQLLDMLRYNSDTEYYKIRKLDQVRTREDYVRIHPLCKYVDLAEYFDRTIDRNEHKVMTSEKPIYYGVTSGTTGKPSKIPVVPYQLSNVNTYRDIQAYNSGDSVPGIRNLSRSMKLYYNVQRLLERAADGTVLGPVSASSRIFDFGDIFTTPEAGYDIPDEATTRYVHLLFGIKHKALTKIETIFVSLAYFAFLDLEKEWKNLVKDVRNGTLKDDLDVTPENRAKLLARLRPDPERADELEREFKKGFKNIAKRIWPELKVIESVSSGPFVHYANAMRQQFTGDVHLYSPAYGASEGLMGMNLWPFRHPENYLIWPYKTFYEFIPLSQVDQPNPSTLFMDQLKKGESYEIVLTTPSGLYRYRLGDVVKIVDFYGQAPVIEFLYRSGQLLNIKAEKVSELCVMDSIKDTVANTNAQIERIVDFTAFESNYADLVQLEGVRTKSSTPYYVILVELTFTGHVEYEAVQKDMSAKLDEALLKNHSDYKWYREKGAIAPLEMHLLKPAAFMKLRTFMLDTTSTSAAQLKLPKVLRKPELLKFMWDQRVVQ